MTDRYAVFGNPVTHSLSPLIHSQFAAQTGRDIHYDRQQVEVGRFTAAVDAFFGAGGKGLNITVPFKLEAFDYASDRTPRARRAGAVNTLALREGGKVLGDNTDGAGMTRDILANQGWQLRDRSVLLLGAGGAVRGVLEPLLAEKPGRVVIANRTVARAEALAAEFADLGALAGCGFDALANGTFDVVINGTAASLAGDLPPLPDGLVTADSCCYDMMYAAEPTVFLRWARARGVTRLADGLGMLVEQAAESFLLWQGVRPDARRVIHLVRAQISR